VRTHQRRGTASHGKHTMRGTALLLWEFPLFKYCFNQSWHTQRSWRSVHATRLRFFLRGSKVLGVLLWRSRTFALVTPQRVVVVGGGKEKPRAVLLFFWKRQSNDRNQSGFRYKQRGGLTFLNLCSLYPFWMRVCTICQDVACGLAAEL
jgi:hypothetical protein